MNLLKHCYYALRYGEWNCGWGMYDDKPMFKFCHEYYDGNWACLHIYKLWITVYY